MTTAKKPLVLRSAVEREYGQIKLRTTVCTENEDGEVFGTSWNYGGYDPGAEFDGFTISAYVGHGGSAFESNETPGQIWGPRVGFQVYNIDTAKQAAAIARVLTRIDKGLQTITNAEGYLSDADYAGYVLRIGRILKINRFYVTNSATSRARSGELHRMVNGSGLQSWVASVAYDVEHGRTSEYVRS
jgi:hypothetical protein